MNLHYAKLPYIFVLTVFSINCASTANKDLDICIFVLLKKKESNLFSYLKATKEVCRHSLYLFKLYKNSNNIFVLVKFLQII